LPDPESSTKPKTGWLTPDDTASIECLLREQGWLHDAESVRSIDKAGEGNMNLALRVTTDQRSMVFKQSRPWVEKYPQVAAPVDRVHHERRFYERASRIGTVAQRMPRVLGADNTTYTLLLEDLGEASDFTTLYEGGDIRADETAALAAWTAALHAETLGEADVSFANRAMRELNHTHIFALPLSSELGLDLEQFEPGLTDVAKRLRCDAALVDAVTALGGVYLSEPDATSCLLHGDLYPGSWLRTEHGVREIDPEFCFFGPAAFDAAVTIAHFALAGQPRSTASDWLETYRESGGVSLAPDLLAGFAGTEVIRRLIGLAQLPLPETNRRRAALLERARTTVLNRNWETLWPHESN